MAAMAGARVESVWQGGSTGDFTADGQVNEADLAYLADNWKQPPPTTALPEPTSLGTLVMGGLSCLRRRCRRFATVLIPFVALLSLLSVATGTASADDFGSGGNQFTMDFIVIPTYPNPTSGYGIVTEDYRIAKYEVTNAQWSKFLASLSPLPLTGTPSFAYDTGSAWSSQPDVPANGISWYEAAQFVNWLNTYAGHHPAYKFTGTQGTSSYTLDAWTVAEAAGAANLYRHKDAFYFMPTDDEWVKAAHWNGSTVQTYANASPADLVDGVPDPAKWNYVSSAGSEPWDVGSGAQELNETFDMMGNVWEWLENSNSGSFDPDALRIMRGGSYIEGSSSLTVYSRNTVHPGGEYNYGGLRIASKVSACTFPDLNCDGVVDVLDIDFHYTNPDDLNNDGSINTVDIEYLVNAMGYRMGDTDLDGSVDEADLAWLADGWKQGVDPSTYHWSTADFTADGQINEADLAYLADNWKQPPPTTALPEPTALALLTIASLITTRRR
jgi:formylglycine-generating enzyme required for sulfatase activity